MRRAAAFLALLLCLYWMRAQGETTSDQTDITTDIWAELKELRDLVITHSVELRKLEQENTVLEVRMNSSENLVKELQRENIDLQARFTACENKSTVLEARMSSGESKIENAVRPKVAFSFGLTDAGHVGPFTTDITLKFSKILFNFGQAYNPITGIFTAPVKGAYYFIFSAWEERKIWIGANLYHNGKRVMWNSNKNQDVRVSVTNALVLQLEKGDVVYMVLPAHHGIWDDNYDRTNFSGFLLFPL